MSSTASRPPNSMGNSTDHSSESAPLPRPANPSLTAAGKAPEKATNATSAKEPLKEPLQPANRPHLIGPPARPKPPTTAQNSAPAAASPATPTALSASTAPPVTPTAPPVIGPISEPSERMQYRAIGLIKGKYVASEEQFNRGNIAIADGTLVDAVLLGRVTSLIKKHIDLDTEHLWVVYPRTLYDDNIPALHVQIVGVWEPETLNTEADAKTDKSGSSDLAAVPANEQPHYLSTAEATELCDIFSIRGEIAKYAEDKNEIVVNIVQKSKSEKAKPKRPFKLLISGQLNGRATGYFWDLKVQRQDGKLVLTESTQIAVVPPKKKSKNDREAGKRRRPAAGKPRPAANAPKPKPKSKSEHPPATHKPTSNKSVAHDSGASAAASPAVDLTVNSADAPDR